MRWKKHQSRELPNEPRATVSRRQVLLGVSAAILVTATLWLLPAVTRWKLRTPARRPGASDEALDVPGALTTTVAFIGALFGRNLTTQDHDELLERLAYTITQESDYAQDYIILSSHLDGLARNLGSKSFIEMTDTDKAAIVQRIMRLDPTALLPRILSRLSAERHQDRRIRVVTVPRLAWLYRQSGVPWRARGCARWPGIPGDWHEYLAAGNAYP